MSQNEFTKLFRYMTERFDKIDERFAVQAMRFDKLETLIDQVLKRQEVDEENAWS